MNSSSSDSRIKKRPLRIAAELRRALPEILRELVVLPNGLLVSITDVVVSDDCSFAKVFFSLLGPDSEERGEEAARLLNAHKGSVRHAIAQSFVMRQHPDLRFIYDPTQVRAARIEELFKRIHSADSTPPEGEPD